MAKKKAKVVDVEVVENDFVPDTQPVVVSTEDQFDMPSDEVRKTVLQLKDKIKDDYVDLCRLLYHVQKKQMYTSWNFSTFDEYVAKEMEFEKSKARHLVQIWECLYERQSNKEVFSKVMSLGWTKASKLIHVVTSENVDGWVEKGKYMSVESLIKDVKDFLQKKISDNPSEALATAGEVEGTPMELAMKSTTLQQPHDDYLATCQAVEAVQAMQPGVSFSQAVALMARDFVATNPVRHDEDPKIAYVEYLKKYEKLSNLQLVIIDPDAKEVLYGFEYIKKLGESWSDDAEDESEGQEGAPPIDAEDAFA